MPVRTLGGRVAGSDAAAIAGPALLALALSLIGITGRSLGFDEGATWAIATQHVPGHGLGAGIAHDGGNMLGFYALEHVLIRAFGDSLLVMRLPSVLAGALTAGFVAAIGLRLFARRTAVLGAVLSAATLSIVYWNQTARGYAAMLAFTCAGMLAFVVLADTPARADTGPRGRWTPVLAYVIAMVLAVYCSFVAVLVIPAQLVALIWRREASRRFLVGLAALLVCAIPLAVLAADRGSGQLFWVSRPDRQVDHQVLESLTGSGLQSSFHPTFLATPGLWITVAAVLAALGCSVLGSRRPGRNAAGARAGAGARAADGEPFAGWGATLVLSWALVGPALVFLYSLVFQPLFQPRNLLTAVPAIAFVLALGICDRRMPRWAAGAALVVALGIRLVPLALSYDVSPEPWNAATRAVLADARPGDCVVFYPEDGHNPFQYYERTARPAGAVAPNSMLPVTGWGEVRSYVERYETLSYARQAALAAACTRLWLVSSHEGQSTGPRRSRRNLKAFDHFRTQLEQLFGRGRVRTYGYASAIHVRLLPGPH